MKIKKKIRGGVRGGGGLGRVMGVRVDVNEELKFLLKLKKKIRWGREVGGVGLGGVKIIFFWGGGFGGGGVGFGESGWM